MSQLQKPSGYGRLVLNCIPDRRRGKFLFRSRQSAVSRSGGGSCCLAVRLDWVIGRWNEWFLGDRVTLGDRCKDLENREFFDRFLRYPSGVIWLNTPLAEARSSSSV